MTDRVPSDGGGKARNETASGGGVLDRLSEHQIEVLREIATGHISFAEYPRSGRVYMGPLLVFAAEDLEALQTAGLISLVGAPALTAAGNEALQTMAPQ